MPTRPSSTFEIVPAIDLRGGRVVRLRQGDFSREDAFSDDPAAVAVGFAEAGAAWLHVVDLDGARAGEPRQTETIGTITVAVRSFPELRVQVAGGLRSAASISSALRAGAARVVLGTAAIDNVELVAAAVREHGSDRIAVALDVRGETAVGDAWVADAPTARVIDLLGTMDRIGVGTLIVTAIERDGLLGGPDIALLETCVANARADVVASAGIRSVEDLCAVRQIGCAGAIVGRALYDGGLDLAEAIRAIRAEG